MWMFYIAIWWCHFCDWFFIVSLCLVLVIKVHKNILMLQTTTAETEWKTMQKVCRNGTSDATLVAALSLCRQTETAKKGSPPFAAVMQFDDKNDAIWLTEESPFTEARSTAMGKSQVYACHSEKTRKWHSKRFLWFRVILVIMVSLIA